MCDYLNMKASLPKVVIGEYSRFAAVTSELRQSN